MSTLMTSADLKKLSAKTNKIKNLAREHYDKLTDKILIDLAKAGETSAVVSSLWEYHYSEKVETFTSHEINDYKNILLSLYIGRGFTVKEKVQCVDESDFVDEKYHIFTIDWS